MMTNHETITLDVRGLPCPHPILRAKKQLAVMAGGSVLRVLATDRAAPEDFAAFCRHTGHILRSSQVVSDDGVFEIVVQRKD